MSGPTNHPSKQLLNDLEAVLKHNKKVLQSTPANVGARGNDIANLIAKADSHFQPTHDSISCQEATTLLKWK